MRSPSLLIYVIISSVSYMRRVWGCTGNAPGMHLQLSGPISTYSFIGSQVNTTPRRLNTLRSTSESITVECT